VKIRLLAFATAARALGAPAAERELPAGSTVAELRAALAAESAALAACLARCAVAVDGELAAPETRLAPGAEVALLPPVSGG
jgi:molybdopterin converting factor subunit 1